MLTPSHPDPAPFALTYDQAETYGIYQMMEELGLTYDQLLTEEPHTMREVLESMTKTDLTALAAELDITGRSSMTKAQLVDAILATQEGGV